MAFIYGTISDASPGAALYAAIADGLTSEGFTLVDTVVISTRTHKIWKCAAANNSHNLDWYLDVIYSTTGSGSLWFAPFEYYDPATDLGYRGIYTNINTSPVDAGTFSRYGSTGYTLETNWNTTSTGLSFTTSPTSFGYWISITPNRIIGLSSASVNDLVYSGFYNPHPLHVTAVGSSSVYPLIYTKVHNNADSISGSSTPDAAFTRVPGLTSFNYNFYYYVQVKAVALIELFNMPMIPSGSTAGFSVRGAVPLLLITDISSFTGFSAIWGTLHDVAVVRANSTVVRGDTTTVSGSPWILTSSNNNRALLFKA